jgi:2,4-dienoyl-CoA reductase-like NADH-dependent reductase (Old Yellow Enzyme family)
MKGKRRTPNVQRLTPNGRGSITLTEQIYQVNRQIKTLRSSYTDLIGPGKGTVSDPEVRREIEGLSAAVKTLRALKPLRVLWNFA